MSIEAALQRAYEVLLTIDAFRFPAYSDREGDVIVAARDALEDIQRLLREQLDAKFLIKPAEAEGAKITWPDADLSP
jgi:hypothetical protein